MIYRYLIILCIFFNGCSLASTQEAQQRELNQQVLIFQDLLKQGWEIQVIDGKTFLVKYTEDGVMIQDVFGLMKENDDSLW